MPANEETKPKDPAPKRSRWVWLGPLLGLVAVIAGMAGWEAWKDYRFEKERTETPPHVVEDLKLKLLWIPAGTFTMGTEDEAEWLKSLKKKYNDVKPSGWGEWKERWVEEEETPTHEVIISQGFYLGETEVTQAQWEAVMGIKPNFFKGANRPVEHVSLEDCSKFCRKLTEREQAAGRIGAKQEFRLPTEAEWEYACRAGSRGEWCFGDDEKRLGEYAWYRPNSGGETHEVGKLRANTWGFYDLHGNVFEWCADLKTAYPSGKMDERISGVITTNVVRVRRGGFRGSWSAGCRSSKRGGGVPGERLLNLGFRLALSSTP